jgi:hypothetical protein
MNTETSEWTELSTDTWYKTMLYYKLAEMYMHTSKLIL